VKRKEDNGGDNSWRAGFSREDAADDAELYRLGLLYDDEDGYERGAGFGLGAMPLAAYAVVTTDRRRRRRAVRTTAHQKYRPPSESSSMQLNSQACLHLSLDLSFAALREDYALAPFLVASEMTNSPDTHAPDIEPAAEYQLQAQCTAKKSDQMEDDAQPDTVHEKVKEVDPQPLNVAPQQHRSLSTVDFFTNLHENARTDDENDSALLCPEQVNSVASLPPDSWGVPEVEETARQTASNDEDSDDWTFLAQDDEKEDDEDMILDADDALSSNTDDDTELESHGWWWWADRNDGS